MNTPDDAHLKRDFENLREDDRRTAPDFVNTVSAGPAVAARRRRSRARIVSVAVFAIAAAVGTVAVSLHRLTTPPPRPANALLSWSSPTAFLLETPGKQLWTETPRLGDREIYGLPSARKESR